MENIAAQCRQPVLPKSNSSGFWLVCLVRRAKPASLTPALAFTLWGGFIFCFSICTAVKSYFLHCVAPKPKCSQWLQLFSQWPISFLSNISKCHLLPSSALLLMPPNLASVLSAWLKPCFPALRTSSHFPSSLPMILLEQLPPGWSLWSCHFLNKQLSQ